MKKGPHAGPVAASLTLHAAIAALLVAGVGNAVPQRSQPKIIQATVVDVTKLTADLERIAEEARQAELEEKQAAEKRVAEERRVEEERIAGEQRAEEERLAKIKREQEEAARKKRETEAEKRRLADLEEKRKADAEAEKKRVADLEAKRKADAEAEKKRLADLEARRKAEADAKLKAEAEAKKKADAEAKARADAERRQREAEEALQAQLEAELKTAMAAEEQHTAAVDAGLLDEYVALIRQKVQRNWIKPASAPLDINCEVSVRQIPGGDVVEVRVLQCNGDQAVVRSIEAAVRKASPLPEPRDASLFQRNLKFRFIPEESG